MKTITYRYGFFIAILFLVVLGIMVYFPPSSMFPPTLLINLDSRPDRLAHIQADFQTWGSPVERISAVKRTPGWKGCSLSHLKCIRLAKERRYPWVLIIEDDCMLQPEAYRRFQALLPFLWQTRDRWDFFNGGVSLLKTYTVVDPKHQLFEVKGYATQFYLVHSGVYDRILDNHPVEPAIPIDVYYEQRFRIWTQVPYLAIQRPGPSDIGTKQNESDYTDIFKDAEALLLENL